MNTFRLIREIANKVQPGRFPGSRAVPVDAKHDGALNLAVHTWTGREAVYYFTATLYCYGAYNVGKLLGGGVMLSRPELDEH